jgi:hypothetical protein
MMMMMMMMIMMIMMMMNVKSLAQLQPSWRSLKKKREKSNNKV